MNENAVSKPLIMFQQSIILLTVLLCFLPFFSLSLGLPDQAQGSPPDSVPAASNANVPDTDSLPSESSESASESGTTEHPSENRKSNDVSSGKGSPSTDRKDTEETAESDRMLEQTKAAQNQEEKTISAIESDSDSVPKDSTSTTNQIEDQIDESDESDETDKSDKTNSDTESDAQTDNVPVQARSEGKRGSSSSENDARKRSLSGKNGISVSMNTRSDKESGVSSVDVEVDIPKNTSITDVRYRSDFPGFEAFLERESMIEKKTYHEDTPIRRSIQVPSYVPAGNHTISAEIQTRDSKGNIHTENKTFVTEVPQKKGVEGLIQRMVPSVSKDAYQELFSFSEKKQNRTRTRPTITEGLTEDETRRLGFDPANTTIIRQSPESKMLRHTAKDKESLRNVTDKRVQDAVNELDEKDPLEVNKTIERYTLVGSDGRQTNVSKVILKVKSEGSKKAIDIIESIPKSIAEDVSELEILGSYEVLEEDPIVRWNFDYATDDEELTAGYIAQKNIDQDTTTSIAAGQTPTFDARVISFLLRGGWFVVLVAAVLVLFVAPTIMYVAKRNRRMHSYNQ
jgi:hypothetical protein